MTSAEERKISIAKRWFGELWSDGNLDIADEIVDPHYAPKWIQIDAKGPAQVRHEVWYFRSIFPDLKYEMIDMVPSEDRIWVRYKGTGTQVGPAWGFNPSGKQVEFEGVTVLYVSPEGMIIDRWGAFCLYDILADLGLVPPIWELSGFLNKPDS
jgi:predicted ester cyclase